MWVRCEKGHWGKSLDGLMEGAESQVEFGGAEELTAGVVGL